MNAVFLQERYGIYQPLSAEGVITIWKFAIVAVDSRVTISEEVIDSLDDTSA